MEAQGQRLVDLGLFSADSIISLPIQQYKDCKIVIFRSENVKGDQIQAISIALANHKTFPILEEVVISNINFSKAMFDMICGAISSRTHDCLWRRITFARCKLTLSGTQQLFRAIYGNPRIEYVNITGNECTDAAIPAIVQVLSKPENKILELDLNNNSLSNNGT
jgi:hypothetical protein